MNPNNNNSSSKKGGSVVPQPREHVSTKMGKKITNAMASAVKNHNDKSKVNPQ